MAIGCDERGRGVTDDLDYPSVELVLSIHEQIVAESDVTASGIRSEAAVESALQYVAVG